MNYLTNMPEWLGTAIVGAVFAALGYLAKTIIDWRKAERKEQAEILSHLLKLQSLLNASYNLFKIQKELAKNLIKLIELNHKDKYQHKDGLEETMTFCYPLMNEEEKELHDIVRAYSEYSLKSVNQSIIDWLNTDKYFITAIIETKSKKKLAAMLTALNTHLILWQAKFAYWIPEHKEHALVYLDDEKNHGLGFPDDLDKTIEEVADELRQRWK